MTHDSDPIERRMLTDLPRQLDGAVRRFDALAVAEEAMASGRPSVLRVVAATAVVVVAAVAAVVAVEGLSGGLPQPGGAPALTSSPTASIPAAAQDRLAAAQEVDAIMSTRLTGEENAIVVHAHGEAVERCMQALGWDYELAPAIPEGEPYPYPGALSELAQWTFADVESAQSDGYGLQPHMAAIAGAIDRMDAGERVSIPDPTTMGAEDAARFELDFFGSEEERIEILERDGSHAGRAGGGCMAEADRALYGDIETEMWLQDARGTASSDIWVAVKADGAVIGAWKSWAVCMHSRGHAFGDPVGAYAAALTAASSGNFEEEHRIAIAHAECTKESDLDSAVTAAFVAAASTTFPELEADLVALQELEAEAVGRAKEILAYDD